jgi:putative ABC transport system ATP-binding protein
LIEMTGIGRSFQVGTEAVHALQAVDLTVRGGEYLSVMGPSGSGKSTLLNIIGLLDRPDSGVYRLDDVNATELNDTQQAAVRRHKIGFVFQFFHLVPRLTAAENVELPRTSSPVDNASGWPLPGPLSCGPASSLRTNRPETWTALPETMSSIFSKISIRKAKS